MALTHHELCYGCGSANLFGLQLELESSAAGVAGRFFVKQDHQGASGSAHAGIIAAALAEAMSLALLSDGLDGQATELRLELHGSAPLGTFMLIEAGIERRESGRLLVSAAATDADGDRRLAEAHATFRVSSDAG